MRNVSCLCQRRSRTFMRWQTKAKWSCVRPSNRRIIVKRIQHKEQGRHTDAFRRFSTATKHVPSHLQHTHTHTRRESETFSDDASCALCTQAFEVNAEKKYLWANYTQILIIIITAQHVKWLIWHRIDRKCVGLSSVGVWVKCRLPSGYWHKRCQMNATEQKSLANSWSVRICICFRALSTGARSMSR